MQNWKRLVSLCRRWCCCWWPLLLEMLKKHLYVIRSLSCGKKCTIQQYVARCYKRNSVTNYLNENVPDYIRQGYWSLKSCDINLLDYAIWDFMKKILYNTLKRYEDMHGIDWKKFINNSIDQWQMRLERVRE